MPKGVICALATTYEPAVVKVPHTPANVLLSGAQVVKQSTSYNYGCMQTA